MSGQRYLYIYIYIFFFLNNLILLYFILFYSIPLYSIIQVEPGKPGAEVSKKKNYKSKKEFAYRMCTG